MGKLIQLKCEVCGNNQFSVAEDIEIDFADATDDTKYRCSDCGEETTKSDLLENNQHSINLATEELVEDYLKQIVKDLKKRFK